jgi:hypothetical protein
MQAFMQKIHKHMNANSEGHAKIVHEAGGLELALRYLKDSFAMSVITTCNGDWHGMLVADEVTDEFMKKLADSVGVRVTRDVAAFKTSKAILVNTWTKLDQIDMQIDVLIPLRYRTSVIKPLNIHAEKKLWISWTGIQKPIVSYEYMDGRRAGLFPRIKLILIVGESKTAIPKNATVVRYNDPPAQIIQDVLKRQVEYTLAVTAERLEQLTTMMDAFREIGFEPKQQDPDTWIRSLGSRGVQLETFPHTLTEALVNVDHQLISKMALCNLLKSNIEEITAKADMHVHIYSPDGCMSYGPENGRPVHLLKHNELYSRLSAAVPASDDGITVIGAPEKDAMDVLFGDGLKIVPDDSDSSDEPDDFDPDRDELKPFDREKLAIKKATALINFYKKNNVLPSQRAGLYPSKLYAWLCVYRRKIAGKLDKPTYPAVTKMLDDNIPNWREIKAPAGRPRKNK